MTTPSDDTYSERPADEPGTLPVGGDDGADRADDGMGPGSAAGSNDPDTETDEDPRFE